MNTKLSLFLCVLLVSFAMAQDAGANSTVDLCAASPIDQYDMGMHVGSIFIILGTSAIGIFTPMILNYFGKQSSSVVKYCLLIGKFFGTGVILATAFVHMLPDAFSNFASPCLPEGWQTYGAFAGVFCMIASLFIQLIEFAAISNAGSIVRQNNPEETKTAFKSYKVTDSATEQTAFDHANHKSHELAGDRAHEIGHFHTAGLLEEGQSFRNIGTLTLELGIVMHSVIIGITLANTGPDEFTTLLIALVFHQFFEGVALGTRINEMNLKSFLKPFIMGCIYIVTTPIGIAIGIGIHTTFNPNSPASILAVSILDSLSAGILLYSAYVELIAMEMNHNPEFLQRSFASKASCFVSMYIGAGLMALIGKWA